MKRALAVALALCALVPEGHAQNAITQEGTVIQNSPMMFRGNNRARQGATVGGAPTGQIVTTGDAVVGGRCDYSAPTDALYYRLCLDAKNGQIIYDGTDSPKGLSFLINGEQIAIGSGGGGGTFPGIVSGVISGEKTQGNSPGDYGGIWSFAGVSVTADTATNLMPSSGIPAWSVNHSFGGLGAGEASRFGVWVNLQQVGNLPTGTGAHVFHTGIFSNVTSNYNSGTSGVGQMYGYAAQVAAGPGYTSTYGLVGGEIDVANSSPNTGMVEGWGVASVPLTYGKPTYHGFNYDAGYGLWAGGSCGPGVLAGGSDCIGFKVGFSFGRHDSYFPIDEHGSMISVRKGVGTTMKADYGIRFVDDDLVTPVQFAVCAFLSAGVCIDGRGNYKLEIGNPFISMKDVSVITPNTNSGLMRLTSNGAQSGANTFQFQVNTAAAGNFSTVVTPIAFGATGIFVTGLNIAQLTPPSSSSPCKAGQFMADAQYIYTCATDNAWKRLGSGATW